VVSRLPEVSMSVMACFNTYWKPPRMSAYSGPTAPANSGEDGTDMKTAHLLLTVSFLWPLLHPGKTASLTTLHRSHP